MKLTQQEISYLSGILTNKSKLSIFSNVKAETIGTEAQSLEEKGILEWRMQVNENRLQKTYRK